MKRIHLLFSRLEIDCSGPAGDTGMGGHDVGGVSGGVPKGRLQAITSKLPLRKCPSGLDPQNRKARDG